MSVHGGGQRALEYYPCRYGESRILFRGPRRQLNGDYIAFLGGTETYGRFIETPFPALLEKKLNVSCANFGVVNAGVDLYLNDPTTLEFSANSNIKVLQVMGAQNMSNRFYTVHPRRNDRFLRASERLETLFPEVDFTDFHFVRHMLGELAEISEDRFQTVVDELRMAWIARMKNLLALLGGPVILMWFANHEPAGVQHATMGGDPLFVTRNMLDALRPRVAGLIEVVASERALSEGTKGMIFNELDACAAAELMGPLAHEEAVEALLQTMSQLPRRKS